MSGCPSDETVIGSAVEDDGDRKIRAKSIGEVASPLLAGFSFTNVIVIVISGDTGHFLLPGWAICSWTIASISFIVSVQFAKYVAEGIAKSEHQQRYWTSTDFSYHVGVVTFLLGFGLALAPQPGAGAYGFRWFASGFVFAACTFESGVYVIRALKWAWRHRPGRAA